MSSSLPIDSREAQKSILQYAEGYDTISVYITCIKFNWGNFMKKIGLLFSTLILVNCTSSVPTDLNFNSANEEGLIVVKINNRTNNNHSITFSKMNPENCHLETTFATGSMTYGSNIVGTSIKDGFVIGLFEPGIWVVRNTYFDVNGVNRLSINHDAASFAFRVEPGKSTFVGTLNISRTFTRIGTNDEDGLNSFLTNYPNIQTKTREGKFWRTGFTDKRNLTVENCNPAPPLT